MVARPLRLAHLAVAAGVVVSALLTAPPATAKQSAAQQLAERYVPVMMIRKQQDPPCDTSEEQYRPTSVDTVLGNPEVTLFRAPAGQPPSAVTKAPTARDIAGLDGDHYLDLPGDPLGDTCVYAKDFAQMLAAGKAPSLVYAHIAREKGHAGFTLQFWFYWYFNQFNDLHESDWEGMQISFDAATPAQALRQDPDEVILFQHAGGERARWGDTKVQKDGTHPIVYAAAGSHATFYDSTVYVENGQHGSGVGCDNTTEPLQRLEPAAELLPSEASRRGPYKWLSYAGRWGQLLKGFNNGPTGPATKQVWKTPFSWMAEQRTTSPRLPGGSIAGPQVTGAFCGAVSTVTDLLNIGDSSVLPLIIVAILIVIAIGLVVALTSWSPIDLGRLQARRSFGQLVRTARRFYGRHWKVLLPAGALAIPIVGGTNLLAQLLEGNKGLSDAVGHSGVDLALSDLLQTFARPVASALVAAIVIVFVRELSQARAAGLGDALGGVRARFWRVVSAQLLATIGIALLALSVIGLPWAIWKLVGWAFVQQEVLFTDKSIRESFRGSSQLVRGRWWGAARTMIFLWLITVVTGPMLTFALIFTPLALTWVDLIGAVVYAALIPYVAVGRTLLYFDLQARAAVEPERPGTAPEPRSGAAGSDPAPA